MHRKVKEEAAPVLVRQLVNELPALRELDETLKPLRKATT